MQQAHHHLDHLSILHNSLYYQFHQFYELLSHNSNHSFDHYGELDSDLFYVEKHQVRFRLENLLNLFVIGLQSPNHLNLIQNLNQSREHQSQHLHLLTQRCVSQHR